MVLTNIYRILCENPENDLSGVVDNMLESIEITSSFWHSAANNYKNEVKLLKNAKLDFEISNGMNGGVIVFVENVNKAGGTLQVIHNICKHQRRTYHGVLFAYFNIVRDSKMDVIPF